MTPRSRQQERLRSLGLAPAEGPRPLHESPAARRLRSRIPRPPLADSPVPAAPYAVDETGTEYHPQVARNMASPAHRRSSVPTPRHHAAPGQQEHPSETAGSASGTARGNASARNTPAGSASPAPGTAVRVSGSESAPARGSEEGTPLTEFLEETDTERLPPPARADAVRTQAPAHVPTDRRTPARGPGPAEGHTPGRAPVHAPGQEQDRGYGDGRPEHPGYVDGPSSAHVPGASTRSPAPGPGPETGTSPGIDHGAAHVPVPGVDRAQDHVSDTGGMHGQDGQEPDELLEDHDTARLRPARTRAPDPRLWNEPPISAQMLRHHRDVTPGPPLGSPGTVTSGSATTPPVGAASPFGTGDDVTASTSSAPENDPGPDGPEDLDDLRASGGTVRLHPRKAGRPAGLPSTAPDRRDRPDPPPTSRRWVGHRPLSEQPREYRRPSWPAAPPDGPRSDTPAHGSPSHDRPPGHHPLDDPPPDGLRNASSDAWPERDPDDSVTVPGAAPDHDAPGIHIPAPPDSPWLDPDDEEVLKERRPPSGYVEFDPRDPSDTPVNRFARMWGPNATLSKRAVIALFVLGAAAVVAALLFLRREPGDVDVPEMVPQSAPDGENGEASGGDGGQEAEGNGASSGGSADPSGDGADGSDEDVVVHMGGDVEDPGLYTLPSGSRVLDAVEEAGGALPDADLDLVNLARPVVDGERILLGAEGAEAAEADGEGDAQRVSLNQADQSALEALPGIGEAKADAILEHRESLGGSFASVEDLLGVSGIGQSTFDNLEDHVTL